MDPYKSIPTIRDVDQNRSLYKKTKTDHCIACIQCNSSHDSLQTSVLNTEHLLIKNKLIILLLGNVNTLVEMDKCKVGSPRIRESATGM